MLIQKRRYLFYRLFKIAIPLRYGVYDKGYAPDCDGCNLTATRYSAGTPLLTMWGVGRTTDNQPDGSLTCVLRTVSPLLVSTAPGRHATGACEPFVYISIRSFVLSQHVGNATAKCPCVVLCCVAVNVKNIQYGQRQSIRFPGNFFNCCGRLSKPVLRRHKLHSAPRYFG